MKIRVKWLARCGTLSAHVQTEPGRLTTAAGLPKASGFDRLPPEEEAGAPRRTFAILIDYALDMLQI